MLEYLTYTGEIMLFSNIILFLLTRAKSSAQLVFLTYLIFVLVIQLYSHRLRDLGEHNLFLSHILFPGQSLLLTFFCLLLIRSVILKRTLLFFTLAAWIIAGLYLLLLQEDLSVFSKMEILVSNVTVLLGLLLYSYENLGVKRVFNASVIGLIIYLIGSSVVFLCGNLLIKLGASANRIWLWHLLLFLLLQLTIMTDVIKQLKNKFNTEQWKTKSFPL
jgi:hypothetical protein